MNILLATNSFKNSLNSVEISEILSKQLSKENNIKVIKAPLSDGGDGFLKVIEFYNSNYLSKYFYKIEFADKLFECPVLIDKSKKILYLESAEIIGLKKIDKKNLNPLYNNSSALGTLLVNLLEDLSKKIIEPFDQIVLGVGGTATIDFGLGALEKLGFQFLDENNLNLQPIPINFSKIEKIKQPVEKPNIKIKCIVDVETKLLGKKNAIEIYGPQKGADKSSLIILKKGIEKIVSIIEKNRYRINIEQLNGAGGGIAAGLNIFLNAEIIHSKFFIKNLLNYQNLSNIDYIITTEGNFDSQSFEGKVTGDIINNFYSKVKNIFLICGIFDKKIYSKIPTNVVVIELINYFQSIENSIANTQYGLEKASKELLKYLNKSLKNR